MIAVPLLLQAVPLQYGSDMLWRILDEDFNAEDWRVRFAAVEKATLIFRLADQEFAYTKTDAAADWLLIKQHCFGTKGLPGVLLQH
jgi:hypothetical protein